MVQYILAVFRKCHSWKKLQNYNPSDSLKRRYKKKKERKRRPAHSCTQQVATKKIDISHISVKLHNETMHTAAKCLTKAKWINSGGTAQHKSNSHRRGK